MTSRYMPNETACPVETSLLGLLMRSPEERVAELVEALKPERRAALAVFCYQRAHLRDLALRVARHCGPASLRSAGGLVGEVILDLLQAPPAAPANGRRKVSLARVA